MSLKKIWNEVADAFLFLRGKKSQEEFWCERLLAVECLEYAQDWRGPEGNRIFDFLKTLISHGGAKRDLAVRTLQKKGVALMITNDQRFKGRPLFDLISSLTDLEQTSILSAPEVVRTLASTTIGDKNISREDILGNIIRLSPDQQTQILSTPDILFSFPLNLAVLDAIDCLSDDQKATVLAAPGGIRGLTSSYKTDPAFVKRVQNLVMSLPHDHKIHVLKSAETMCLIHNTDYASEFIEMMEACRDEERAALLSTPYVIPGLAHMYGKRIFKLMASMNQDQQAEILSKSEHAAATLSEFGFAAQVFAILASAKVGQQVKILNHQTCLSFAERGLTRGVLRIIQNLDRLSQLEVFEKTKDYSPWFLRYDSSGHETEQEEIQARKKEIFPYTVMPTEDISYMAQWIKNPAAYIEDKVFSDLSSKAPLIKLSIN